jgi:predicted ester cyclase
MIISDDQSVLVWNATGTHQGTLMNIPPTGRVVSVRGVTVLTIIDHKIVNALYLWDVAGLLRGFGLLPEL